MSETRLWRRRYPAPAKLNLFLHVVGRRADGYHLLQSALRLVDWCDWLRFYPRADSKLVLRSPLPGIPEEQELSVRAARLLQAETGCRRGVEIAIEKRLPLGGGLGGGSSDCATTLVVLNRLWRLGLDRKRLATLGLRLGADVPFFLFGRSAFAQGIGERLSPLDLPRAWYVVLVPPVSVPTAEIFAAPELTRNTRRIKIKSFSANSLRNDLQPVVCARYTVVAEHLAWLSRYARARLSGAGACVFAEFASQREARAVLARLPAGMRGVAVRGLDRHPLAKLLGAKRI